MNKLCARLQRTIAALGAGKNGAADAQVQAAAGSGGTNDGACAALHGKQRPSVLQHLNDAQKLRLTSPSGLLAPMAASGGKFLWKCKKGMRGALGWWTGLRAMALELGN